MRLLLAIAALALMPSVAQAQLASNRIPEPRIEGGRLGAAYRPLIEELRRGGLVLLFRHDRTETTGLWDYESFEAGECDRERRVSAAGEASARAIGAAIRQLRIPVTRVIASTYCRAIESAAFMFGGVHRAVPDLIGPDGKERVLAHVQRDMNALIRREVDPRGVLVLVGHHGTIDAFTTRMLDEGDALLIRPRASGNHDVLAHMPAARWEEIARDLDRELVEARRSAAK
jgi:phosphohistidine phosphatase SixA